MTIKSRLRPRVPHPDYVTLAERAAGNWQRVEGFEWYNRPDGAKHWAILDVSDPTSGTLRRFKAMILDQQLDGFDDDVRFPQFDHWKVGYVNSICVRVYGVGGTITAAFKALCDAAERLGQNPFGAEQDDHANGQLALPFGAQP